jgi:hypothetical protein
MGGERRAREPDSSRRTTCPARCAFSSRDRHELQPTAYRPDAVSVIAATSSTSSASNRTGVVFESSEQGRRPIPGAKVTVVDSIEGPYGFLGFIELTTDANGRFALAPRMFSGRTVILTAVQPGSAYVGQLDLFQTRAVHSTVPAVDADTTVEVEIELVPRGVQPRTLDSPVLSGVIFESTAEGPRPVADRVVYYTSMSIITDSIDVYGRTDAEGRYRFWNIPVGAGYLLPVCTRAPTPLRFPVVDVRGDTVLNATCQ